MVTWCMYIYIYIYIFLQTYSGMQDFYHQQYLSLGPRLGSRCFTWIFRGYRAIFLFHASGALGRLHGFLGASGPILKAPRFGCCHIAVRLDCAEKSVVPILGIVILLVWGRYWYLGTWTLRERLSGGHESVPSLAFMACVWHCSRSHLVLLLWRVLDVPRPFIATCCCCCLRPMRAKE